MASINCLQLYSLGVSIIPLRTGPQNLEQSLRISMWRLLNTYQIMQDLNKLKKHTRHLLWN